MNLVMSMSNSEVFGSPMILTGLKPVSPFGAATYAHSSQAAAAKAGRGVLRTLCGFFASMGRGRRIRKTVVELSKLDDRVLRDIGLDRSAIVSAAQQADGAQGHRRFRR
jgi:uncharacterized protein YjiS (DUF1127 family)